METVLTRPEPAAADPVPAEEQRRRRRRRRPPGVLRRAVATPRGRIGFGLALTVVAVAAIGPLVAPYSPTEFTTTPFAPAGTGGTLGGDYLGRDVLSRVLHGGWVLLLMAVAATALGVAVGAVLGTAAAYLRDPADGIIMRTVDVILAFPQLVFALLLVSVVGAEPWLVVVAVAVSHAPQVARVLRSAALDVSERDFVKAAELNGVPPARIMRREILPHLTTPLLVETGLRLTYSIIVIAGLAFLGFGMDPSQANWGIMINENRLGLTGNAFAVAIPAALVALLTIGTNVLADAVARTSRGADGRAEEELVLEAFGVTAR